MKSNYNKYLFLILIFIFSTQLHSQTKLYVHPDGDRYAFNTETIAILPLRTQVKLRPKELKDFTPEQIIQMGKDESLDIQKECIRGFSKESKEVS
jgi:hypothetical protein